MEPRSSGSLDLQDGGPTSSSRPSSPKARGVGMGRTVARAARAFSSRGDKAAKSSAGTARSTNGGQTQQAAGAPQQQPPPDPPSRGGNDKPPQLTWFRRRPNSPRQSEASSSGDRDSNGGASRMSNRSQVTPLEAGRSVMLELASAAGAASPLPRSRSRAAGPSAGGDERLSGSSITRKASSESQGAGSQSGSLKNATGDSSLHGGSRRGGINSVINGAFRINSRAGANGGAPWDAPRTLRKHSSGDRDSSANNGGSALQVQAPGDAGAQPNPPLSASKHGASFFRPPSLYGFSASAMAMGNGGADEVPRPPSSPMRNQSVKAKELFRASHPSRTEAMQPQPGDTPGQRFEKGQRANVLRQALLDSRPITKVHDADRTGGVAGPSSRFGGTCAQSTQQQTEESLEVLDKELDHALFNCFAFVPIEVVCRLHAGLEHDAGAPTPNASGAYVGEIDVAVLFSDVSGFTQLTARLQREKGGEEGAEMLNEILNHFFERLICIVHEYDGDVIKFAGDAVLSIWSATSGETIEELVALASRCALAQLEELDHYQGGFDTTLRLHLGLGAGRGTGIDLGTRHRREFVVAGPPLEEMGSAEGIAGHGEVVVGPTAWEHLEEAGRGPVGTLVEDEEHVAKHGEGFRILHRLANYEAPAVSSRGLPRGEWVHQMQRQLLERRSEKLLEELQRYTAEPVRHHLRAASLQYSTEFREATMLFIRITRVRFDTADGIDRLQQAVLQIMERVGRYEGTITRISIDDKGTVLKVTFGLPPFLHTDDPTRGVLCAMSIRDAVRTLRLRACIGITTGHVFVGCVGAEHRCEYTEYGDKVNMAARYMSNAVNEVFCDEETHTKCAKSIDWDVLKPIKVKGKDDPVPVFRPFAQLQPHELDDAVEAGGASSAVAARGALDVLSNRAGEFVGRANEMSEIVNAIDSLTRDELDPSGPEDESAAADEALLLEGTAALRRRKQRTRVIVVTGEAGLGKTRLVEEVQRRTVYLRPDAVAELSRGSSTESSTLLYPWSAIFRRVLDSFRSANGTDSMREPEDDLAREIKDREFLHALLPPALSDHASLLNSVLGLSLSHSTATLALADDVKAEAVTTMLVHMLALYAHKAPTVVIMEDVHFLDSASWKLLNAIVARLLDNGSGDLSGGAAGKRTTQRQSLMANGGGDSLRAQRPSDAMSDPESLPGGTKAAEVAAFPGTFALAVTCQTVSGVGLSSDMVALTKLPETMVVHLGPMSPGELVRIVRNQLGARSLSQKAARLLPNKAAGSPFFCLELVKLLREQGVLTVEDGVVQVRDVNRDGKGSDIAVPDSVEQAIVSRIDRLSRKYLMALKCASVAGNDFVDEMLATMLPEVGIGASEVPTIVSELCDMGLLEQCAGSKYYTHSFKSALVKDVVYERLPFNQRRELHAAVAQWIEGRYRDELSSFYPVLALHWKRAALDGEAVRYFELCAKLALKHYANHEAVGFLNEVLTIVHSCSPEELEELNITVETHAKLASQLADAALRIGLVAQAMEAVELLLDSCDMPLPSGSLARKRALLAVELAWSAVPLKVRARAPTWIRRRPETDTSCELVALGYQMASRAYYFTGDVLSHDIVALRGLDVATRVKGAQLCRSLAAAALAHGRIGRIKTALSLQRQALAMCEVLPTEGADENNLREPTTLYCTMMQGMLAAVELCNWEDAERAFDTTMSMALELGMWRRYEESANQKALVMQAQGRLEDASQILGKAARSAEGRKDVQMYATLACTRVAVLLMLRRHGSVDTAVQELERLEERLASTGSAPLLISLHGAVAMAKLQCTADLDGALQSAQTALASIRQVRMPSQFALFFAYAHVAHVLVEVFERFPSEESQAQAAEAVGQLELFASRFRAAGPRFLLYRGVLAWLLDRPAEANKSWSEAQRLAQRFNLRYEAAHIQWEVAHRTDKVDMEEAARDELADIGVDVGEWGGAPVAHGANGKPKLSRQRQRPTHAGSSPRVRNTTNLGLRRAAKGRGGRFDTKAIGRKRLTTDETLIDDSNVTSDRFDVSMGTAGLDWAKGAGPGAVANAENAFEEEDLDGAVDDDVSESNREDKRPFWMPMGINRTRRKSQGQGQLPMARHLFARGHAHPGSGDATNGGGGAGGGGSGDSALSSLRMPRRPSRQTGDSPEGMRARSGSHTGKERRPTRMLYKHGSADHGQPGTAGAGLLTGVDVAGALAASSTPGSVSSHLEIANRDDWRRSIQEGLAAVEVNRRGASSVPEGRMDRWRENRNQHSREKDAVLAFAEGSDSSGGEHAEAMVHPSSSGPDAADLLRPIEEDTSQRRSSPEVGGRRGTSTPLGKSRMLSIGRGRR